MEIARGVETSAWAALKLDHPKSPDWKRAVRIFLRRINGRYVKPVDVLVRQDSKRLPKSRQNGFAVLAIDCLLIETLYAFLYGKRNTKGQSKEAFELFLTTTKPFSTYFKNKKLTDQFYKNFRCGVLHQAEIGGDDKLWSVGPLLKMQGTQMTVNRTELHERLKTFIKTYVRDIEAGFDLQQRKNFRKKMDSICKA